MMELQHLDVIVGLVAAKTLREFNFGVNCCIKQQNNTKP